MKVNNPLKQLSNPLKIHSIPLGIKIDACVAQYLQSDFLKILKLFLMREHISMQFLELISMEADFNVFFWKGPVSKDREYRLAQLRPGDLPFKATLRDFKQGPLEMKMPLEKFFLTGA